MSLLMAWLATFAVCAISGPLPVVHSELYLIGVAAVSPRSWVWALITAAVLGQLVGKSFLYFVGRGAIRIRNERFQRMVNAAREKMEKNPKTGGGILFVSAVLGIPPMFPTALACGAARMNYASFLVLTAAGRFVHYPIFVFVPQLARGWFTRS